MCPELLASWERAWWGMAAWSTSVGFSNLMPYGYNMVCCNNQHPSIVHIKSRGRVNRDEEMLLVKHVCPRQIGDQQGSEPPTCIHTVSFMACACFPLRPLCVTSISDKRILNRLVVCRK